MGNGFTFFQYPERLSVLVNSAEVLRLSPYLCPFYSDNCSLSAKQEITSVVVKLVVI